MPQSQFSLPESQTLLERLTCERCGSWMRLTRIEPDIEDHERRIFECPFCKQAEAKFIKFR